MIVMKRYCDYDYDQNCIVLFDAVDCDDSNAANISWIGCNDTSKNKANKPKKIIPFRQHLEMIYARKQSEISVLKSCKISTRSKSNRKQKKSVKPITMTSEKYIENNVHVSNEATRKFTELPSKKLTPLEQSHQIFETKNKYMPVASHQTNINQASDYIHPHSRKIEIQHDVLGAY
eukprot:278063_1